MFKLNRFLSSHLLKDQLQFVWVIWTVILLFSYFYNMITLPGRFEKIRDFVITIF